MQKLIEENLSWRQEREVFVITVEEVLVAVLSGVLIVWRYLRRREKEFSGEEFLQWREKRLEGNYEKRNFFFHRTGFRREKDSPIF